MPSLNIPQKLLDKINALTQQPIELHEAPTPECTHWRLTQGQQQIACSCNPQSISALIDLINQLSQVASPSKSLAPSPLNIPSRSKQESFPLSRQTNRSSGLTFSSAAQEVMCKLNLLPEDVQDIIDNPEEIHPAYQWRTLYRAKNLDVIHAAETNTVISIKKSAPENIQHNSSQPRLTGQKTQFRESLPSDVSQMKDRLIHHGFLIHHGGKHWKITHSESPGVYASMPYTPSDNRWALNLVSEIRMKFGIDLRT